MEMSTSIKGPLRIHMEMTPMDEMGHITRADTMRTDMANMGKTVMHTEEHMAPSRHLNTTISTPTNNSNSSNNRPVKCHRGTGRGGTEGKHTKLVILTHRHHLSCTSFSAQLSNLYYCHSTLHSHQCHKPPATSRNRRFNLYLDFSVLLPLKQTPVGQKKKKKKEHFGLVVCGFSIIKEFLLFTVPIVSSGCSPADQSINFPAIFLFETVRQLVKRTAAS